MPIGSKFTAGQTYEKLVSSFDIYAPAAANCEGVIAPELVEGVDLVPFVTGKKKGIPHETLFWRQGGPWLTCNPQTERFTGEKANAANALLKDPYNKGLEVPDAKNV